MSKREVYLKLVEMSVRQRKKRNQRNQRRNNQQQGGGSNVNPNPTPTNPANVGPQAPTPAPTPTRVPRPTVPTVAPRRDLDRTSHGTNDVGNVLGASRFGRNQAAAAARKVRARGGSNTEAERAGRVAGREGEARFRRGMNTIGRTATSLIKKGLNRSKNLPSGGRSLV